MDKFLAAMFGEKIGDVAIYLLLVFALVCPGIAVMYVFEPSYFDKYELSKLLLLSVSVSGPFFVAYIVVLWMCCTTALREIELKQALMLASFFSSMSVYLALLVMFSLNTSRTPRVLIGIIHVFLSCLAVVFSQATAKYQVGKWSRIFNMGNLIAISGLASLPSLFTALHS